MESTSQEDINTLAENLTELLLNSAEKCAFVKDIIRETNGYTNHAMILGQIFWVQRIGIGRA